MKLEKFKVTKFRSILDSGWIETNQITSLVGINEAGKSNIILALWKLNPVNEGQIDPLHDMPASKYAEWRHHLDDHIFISCKFKLNDEERNKIVDLSGCQYEDTETVLVQRNYAGKFLVQFIDYREKISLSPLGVQNFLTEKVSDLMKIELDTKIDNTNKDKFIDEINSIKQRLSITEEFSNSDKNIFDGLSSEIFIISSVSKLKSWYNDLRNNIELYLKEFKIYDPNVNNESIDFILEKLPNFVYYSNYGNLDAQIYLPHAIKWLNGEEVKGIKNDDKVRTLRVLFEFVNLNPEEVLELGQGPVTYIEDRFGKKKATEPTEKEIQESTKKKEERTILLNSASSDLTREFKSWWKQGEYIFRFQADGEFFKIWVSDEKRADEIELERRSTGLQWFLSFFLVFLVESKNEHKDAILLLDEAGLSLHPLAQKDLISFFKNLSKENQLIYTTHSPFLVDTSNIDQVKVVYSNEKGHTVVSSDLRASDDKLNEESIYAVHAALGLSVSDILLQGCQTVVVEGPSDQYYLNGIKQVLIREGKLKTDLEIVFVPSGGVRGIPGIVSLTSGKNQELPKVILDSDGSGKHSKKRLETGLYKGNESKIINIGDYIDIDNGEIEDIVPYNLMSRYIDRMFRDLEHEVFEDVYDSSKSIVDQIESFAVLHGIELNGGWKVDLSRNVKNEMLKAKNHDKISAYLSTWVDLFKSIAE